ncbi:HD domain-containing protein [Kribbella orskensis]|uniref:HD domain-containing protein n=1 Tax=Kribbella orskensis TaxID=2512216 RepID=A0ABY2BGI1_9ACTN|nr:MULTISPECIES: HD domain-containing protein [Kribbella]TCN38034.1 HD domain-containing protein [Kribbella sp. VKM Ac-2500]TCO19521.1 HD domain-containing protein [Kribbella orskensis]
MKVYESWRTWTEAEPDLRDRLPAEVVDRLGQAYRYAETCHADQRRPAGEPYVEHLLQALEIALDVGVTSPEVLTATLLHDVVEDTPATIEDVRERFGPRTADLVAWVTKPEPQPDEDPKAVRAAYLESFADAPPDVLVVKLADRYSNVQRLDTHPRPTKQASYYRETVRAVAPLTARAPQFARLFEDWQNELAYLASDPTEQDSGRTERTGHA